MDQENMFIYATKNKLRYPYVKGNVNTEDLWDLNVKELDSIYKKLNRESKAAQEESLLENKTKANKVLDIKIGIIKYIVEQKLAEKDKALKAKENAEKKQKIAEILNNKRNEALNNMSEEELQKMLDSIE